MSQENPPSDESYAATIGDLVASRKKADRAALQRRVAEALQRTNDHVSSLQPLQITVGDEFQGLYEGVAAALEATLWVRLALHDVTDVRFGIGWGSLLTVDSARTPFGQDGPAWWRAREAVDRAAGAERRHASPRGSRTVFVDPDRGSLEGVVNAYLVSRDQILSGMDERDARLLAALLAGDRQADIAKREAVSQSAVSQRLVRDGGYALARSLDAIRGVL